MKIVKRITYHSLFFENIDENNVWKQCFPKNIKFPKHNENTTTDTLFVFLNSSLQKLIFSTHSKKSPLCCANLLCEILRRTHDENFFCETLQTACFTHYLCFGQVSSFWVCFVVVWWHAWPYCHSDIQKGEYVLFIISLHKSAKINLTYTRGTPEVTTSFF